MEADSRYKRHLPDLVVWRSIIDIKTIIREFVIIHVVVDIELLFSLFIFLFYLILCNGTTFKHLFGKDVVNDDGPFKL